jgi:hypothetical protein
MPGGDYLDRIDLILYAEYNRTKTVLGGLSWNWMGNSCDQVRALSPVDPKLWPF